MSSPVAHAPRKFFWPLFAGMVVVFIAYLVALGTDLFDIAPEVYPEMQPKGKAGNSVPVQDVLAASPAFQRWKVALADAGANADNLHIEEMLLGLEKPDQSRLMAWLWRAHLALFAMEEISANPSEWADEGNAVPIAGAPSIEARGSLYALRLSVSRLNSVYLPNQTASLRLLRAQFNFSRKLGDCDQTSGWFTLLHHHTEAYHTAILKIMAFAPWADKADALLEISSMLDYSPSSRNAQLENAVRGDFRATASKLQMVRKETLEDGPWVNWQNNTPNFRKQMFANWWNAYRMQPNRLVRTLRPHISRFISDIPLPAKQRATAKAFPEPTLMDKLLPWPNSGITCVLAQARHPDYGVLRHFDKEKATARLTEMVVAIARYRLANEQTLPSTLADLVPLYLPAVPLDPFDGLPLRYHQEKQLIWSVGANLTDDLGDFDKASTTSIPGVHFGHGDSDLVIELDNLFGPHSPQPTE